MVIGFNNATKEKVGVFAGENVITLTKTSDSIRSGSMIGVVFDRVDISGYSGYVVLEYSEYAEDDSKKIGAYMKYVNSNYLYPYVSDASTETQLRLSMEVINYTDTTQPIIGEVKVLLIP